MVRKIVGSVAGTAVFVAGFYWLFAVRGNMPAHAALREAVKLGFVYLATHTLIDHFAPGK